MATSIVNIRYMVHDVEAAVTFGLHRKIHVTLRAQELSGN